LWISDRFLSKDCAIAQNFPKIRLSKRSPKKNN
jgi:hypothetical protein